MDDKLHTKVADDLLAAYASRTAIEPLTATYPGLSPQDAYTIQLKQAALRKARGARIVGHKVGLTSAPMRRALGVNEPDYGHLFDDMVLPLSRPIETARYIAPRIEPEFAFVLAEPLKGPGVTKEDALNAIAYGVGAIELIDSRIRDWKIALADTIADNGSSGGFVLGEQRFDPRAVDIRLTGCLLTLNGNIVESGAGGAVLGHPLESVAWLANALGALGVTLEAGHIIMSGSITAPIFVRAGDVVLAEFDGLGQIDARFV